MALGAEFTVDEEVALDTFDEWMELDSLPQHFEINPKKRELLGRGRTLHFHATDTTPEAAAEWLIDLTGDAIVWRRALRRPPSLCAARWLTCCWSSTGRCPLAARALLTHRFPRPLQTRRRNQSHTYRHAFQ